MELRAITVTRLRRFRRLNRYAREGDGLVSARRFKLVHGRIGLPALTSTGAYEQLRSILLTYFRKPGSTSATATVRELAALLQWDKRTTTLMMSSLRPQAEILVARRKTNRESVGDISIDYDGNEWCITVDSETKPEDEDDEVEDEETSVAEGGQSAGSLVGPTMELDPLRLVYRMIYRSGSQGVRARDLVKYGTFYQKQAIRVMAEMMPGLRYGCSSVRSGQGRSSVLRFIGPADVQRGPQIAEPAVAGGGGVVASHAAPPPPSPSPAPPSSKEVKGRRKVKGLQLSKMLSVEKQGRIEAIMDLLRTQRVFTNVMVSDKVNEIEKARKMDRKSLFRILESLEKEGLLATSPINDGTQNLIIRAADMSVDDEVYKAFVEKIQDRTKAYFFDRNIHPSASSKRIRRQVVESQGGAWDEEGLDADQLKEYLRIFKVTTRPMVKVKVIHQCLWEMFLEQHSEANSFTFTMYDMIHRMPVGFFVRVVGLKADEWSKPALEELRHYVQEKAPLPSLPIDLLSRLLASYGRWNSWFRDGVYVLITLGLVEGNAGAVARPPDGIGNNVNNGGPRVYSEADNLPEVLRNMLEGLDRTQQLVVLREVSIPLTTSEGSNSGAAQSVFGGNAVNFVLKVKEDVEAYWKTLKTFALNSVPLKAGDEDEGLMGAEAEEGEGAYKDRARGIGGGLTQLSEDLRKRLRMICQERAWVHIPAGPPIKRQRAVRPKKERKRKRPPPTEKKRKKPPSTTKSRPPKKSRKEDTDWIEQAMDISAGEREEEEEDEDEEEEEEETEESRRFDEILIEEFVKQRCRPFQSKREVPLLLQTEEEAAMRQARESTQQATEDALVSQMGSKDVFQVQRGTRLRLEYGPMMEKSGRSRSSCFERLRYLLRHKEKAEKIRARLLVGRSKVSPPVTTASPEEVRLDRIHALSDESPVLAAIFIKIKQVILSAEIPSEQAAGRAAFQIFDGEAIRRVYRMMWDEGWLEERWASKKAAAVLNDQEDEDEDDEEGGQQDADEDMSSSSQQKSAARTRRVKDGMKFSKRFWDCLREASWVFPAYFYEQLTGEEPGVAELQDDLSQGQELSPAAVAHLVEMVPNTEAKEALWMVEVQPEEDEEARQQDPAKNKQGILAPVIRRIKTELTQAGIEAVDQRVPCHRASTPPPTSDQDSSTNDDISLAIHLMQTGGNDESAVGGQDEMVPRDVNDTLATALIDAEYSGLSLAELCSLADKDVVLRWLRQVMKQGEVVRVPGFFETRFVLYSNADCWLLPGQEEAMADNVAVPAVSWVHFNGHIHTDLLVKALRAIVGQIYTVQGASLAKLHQALPHFTFPELVILLRGLVQAHVIRTEIIHQLQPETLTQRGRVVYREGGVGPWDYDMVGPSDLMAYPMVDCLVRYAQLEYRLKGNCRHKVRTRTLKKGERSGSSRGITGGGEGGGGGEEGSEAPTPVTMTMHL